MSDTFRKEYKPLSEKQKDMIADVKNIATILEELFTLIDTPDCGREIAIAKTNLEQSIMWAVKGITK